MKKINQISKIIRQQFHTQALSIKAVHTGFDHHIFFVKTPKKELVFRFPRRRKHNLNIQAWVTKEWLKRSIPVPRIFCAGRNYIVEEKIDGTDMGHTTLTLRQRQKIMYQVGKTLYKMHTVKTRKYGQFVRLGIGKEKTWKAFILKRFKRNLFILKKCRYLPRIKIQRIKKTYQRYESVLNYYDPRLLHFDATDVNILVKDRQFKALIDYGDAASGDPLYELGMIHTYFKDKTIPYLLKGYGKTDFQKVLFYAFLHSLFLSCLFLTEIKNTKLAKRFLQHAFYYEKKLKKENKKINR